MKRRREVLSSDEEYVPEIAPPKNKRRRRSRSTTTSNTNKEKENNDTTNTNSSTSRKNKKANRKQSNLSSYFDVPAPTNDSDETKEESDNESISSEVSSIPDDYFEENQLKWSCNVIRGKIRKLLETPGIHHLPPFFFHDHNIDCVLFVFP